MQISLFGSGLKILSPCLLIVCKFAACGCRISSRENVLGSVPRRLLFDVILDALDPQKMLAAVQTTTV
jgi:hypothetical protein